MASTAEPNFQDIIAVLQTENATSKNKGKPAKEICKVLRDTYPASNKESVNNILYSMRKLEMLEKDNSMPPLWWLKKGNQVLITDAVSSRAQENNTNLRKDLKPVVFVDLDCNNQEMDVLKTVPNGSLYGFQSALTNRPFSSWYPNMNIEKASWNGKHASTTLMIWEISSIVLKMKQSGVLDQKKFWILSKDKTVENVYELLTRRGVAASVINDPLELASFQ